MKGKIELCIILRNMDIYCIRNILDFLESKNMVVCVYSLGI